MTKVAVGPALAGAGASTFGYLLVTAVAAPALLPVLLRMPQAAVVMLLLLATVLPLVLGGVVSAVVLRGRRVVPRRVDALPSAVAGGLVGSLVVSMLGVAAEVSMGRPVELVPVAVTVVVACASAAVGALLVPPGGQAADAGPLDRPWRGSAPSTQARR